MQPGDACGLGRIYLAFPILISVFLSELVKTRQPAIPEVKGQSWYLIFLFLIFCGNFSPFCFPSFVILGHRKVRASLKMAAHAPQILQCSLSVELMFSGLAEGTSPCFLPSFLLLQTLKWIFLLPRTSFCCLIHVPSEWRLSLQHFGLFFK